MDTPFWLTDASPAAGPVRLDEVDVEIVGAGITGCSCALTLAEAGRHVRVRDRRGVAEGASGRNGGFAGRGGAIQPARLVRRLAAAAAGAGVEFRTGARVETLDELGADQVVVATDGSGRGLLPGLDETISPARGQVIATEPLPERLFDCPH